MIHRDPFERDLEQALSPRPAPEALQRRVARIPLDHPRARDPRGTAPWRRWLDAAAVPWAAGAAAALASLALGFWLGFSGIVDGTVATDTGNDEELASLVFPGVPATMGEYQ